MICPTCKREIADGSTICPVCNTHFTYTQPVQNQTIPVQNQMINHNNQNPAVGNAVVANNIESNVVNQAMNNQSQIVQTAVNANTAPPATVQPVVIQTGGVNPNVQRVVPVNTASQAQVNRAVVPQGQVQQNVVLPPQQTNEEKKKMKSTDLFFLGVIIVGSIILVILIISLFLKNKAEDDPVVDDRTSEPTYKTTAPSENVGARSSYNLPMRVGEVTLASIHDPTSDKYYDVDVKGLRFIEGVEAEELARNYVTDSLNDGFTWYAFEYQVTFNDLKTLAESGLSPVLESKGYHWNGSTFITYNGENYTIKMYSIYNGGAIVNKKSAIVKVVYQLPPTEKEYSLCFGEYRKTMGCFTKYQKN